MQDLNYGKGYRYAHDDPKSAKDQTHLPDQLKGRRYYRPTGSSPPNDDKEDLSAPW
jgi:putative ATPase